MWRLLVQASQKVEPHCFDGACALFRVGCLLYSQPSFLHMADTSSVTRIIDCALLDLQLVNSPILYLIQGHTILPPQSVATTDNDTYARLWFDSVPIRQRLAP